MQLHARPRNFRRNEFLTKLRFDPAFQKGNEGSRSWRGEVKEKGEIVQSSST